MPRLVHCGGCCSSLTNINDQVYIAHNKNLEDLLSTMNDNGKHKAVVKIEKPLIEKRSRI